MSSQSSVQPSASLSASSNPKSFAVFLAAHTGTDPKYADFIREVAKLFSENKWKLVYGGSGCGLMGILAQTASALGVDVHGVRPESFLKFEKNGQLPDFGRHELVDDLDSQKKRILELSDALIFLPGGFGTLEEFATTRIWKKLGYINHPIVIVNFDNFFTPFVDWITKARESGFISDRDASGISVVENLNDLGTVISKLEI